MSEESAPQSLRRRRPSWLAPVWLVPILCGIGLGYFVYREVEKKGPTIGISFSNGEGLEARKTDLKFRGVRLGGVMHVKLSPDLRAVVAEVELDRSATDLAREGSQFWIVRPYVSAAGIHGLGAIVSGAYIEALPGHGAPADRFEGLEEPPAIQGTLRILQVYVFTQSRKTFEPGAPVLYHDIKVGAVSNCGLSSDATGVRCRLAIERPYEELVRTNSQFWNAGGVHVHIGLGGVDMSAQSFQTMIFGGIAFATPDKPGPLAADGTPFALADKAKSDWLKWRPKIPLEDQPPETER